MNAPDKDDNESGGSSSGGGTSESDEQGLFGFDSNTDESLDDDDFVCEINDNKAIKLQVYKLNERNHYDLIWDLQEYLIYKRFLSPC